MTAKTSGLSAEKQTQKNSLNMLVMLAAPTVMAWYYYGFRALLLTAVCAATAAFCDFAGNLLIKSKKKQLYDFTAVLTGVLIAMMLPASFPFILAAAGCAFAVIAVKLPFGGGKSAPFMPAAAGFAFMSVCWPGEVFDYPAISAQFEMFNSAAPGVPGPSLAAMLQAGNSMRLTPVSILNLLTGNFPGPMGTGCILVLLATAAYFLFTRPAALLNTLGMFMSCGAMALIFERIRTGPVSSLLLEVCSGSLVFAALFLITDTAASPQKPLHRLLYGAFAGFSCMLLRYFGVFEEGVCFAVLLTNAVWPVVENIPNKFGIAGLKQSRKSKLIPSSSKKGGGTNA